MTDHEIAAAVSELESLAKERARKQQVSAAFKLDEIYENVAIDDDDDDDDVNCDGVVFKNNQDKDAHVGTIASVRSKYSSSTATIGHKNLDVVDVVSSALDLDVDLELDAREYNAGNLNSHPSKNRETASARGNYSNSSSSSGSGSGSGSGRGIDLMTRAKVEAEHDAQRIDDLLDQLLSASSTESDLYVQSPSSSSSLQVQSEHDIGFDATLHRWEQRLGQSTVSLDVHGHITTGRSAAMWATMDDSNLSLFARLAPDLAIKHPFELDDFQKRAVMRMQQGQNVFVSAHTSAGKTVVAEYAIALAAKHLTRAVYTSPIKTLSNQKFREFRRTFGERDVGVVTGDVSINPEASCLILTTEILRSMLYKGADLVRDLEWVIFDEVHYINDRERGVVWEEVIILLPAHVKVVLLSATVPNVLDFADWVGRTRKQHVYVVATTKRPVPLQHYLWTKNDMFQVVDKHGAFNSANYREAKIDPEKKKLEEQLKGKAPTVQQKQLLAKQQFARSMKKPAKTNWNALITFLLKRELLPVAVFSFSKKQCEDAALALLSLDLTSSSEKNQTHILTEVALSRLSANDRQLPQVVHVKETVSRGIGIHHAGMLPILKELVEMAFSKGLVKVLFATETFAMGVNMPAKTVVFNGLRKHDGQNFRDILAGEYTQMSGRAGRRGLDSFGVVVVNCRGDQVPEEAMLRQVMTGQATVLESRFRLTYNMIINLLRQEDLKVEDVMKQSFMEAGAQRDAPQKKLLLKKGEEKLKMLEKTAKTCVNGCSHHDMLDYYHFSHMAQKAHAELMQWVMQHNDKMFHVGSVVMVNKYAIQPAPIAVVVQTSASKSASSFYTAQQQHLSQSLSNCLVLALLAPNATIKSRHVRSIKASSVEKLTERKGQRFALLDIKPQHVVCILRPKLDVVGSAIVNDSMQQQQMHAVVDALAKLQTLFDDLASTHQNHSHDQNTANNNSDNNGGASSTSQKVIHVDLLPEKMRYKLSDMKLQDLDAAENASLLLQAQCALAQHPVGKCIWKDKHVEEIQKQAMLQEHMLKLRSQLSNDNLILSSESHQRMAVLEELNYISADKVVQVKGRVACEINTCDSLILTELIFENVLTDLSAEEIASLFSCLVFQEKSPVEPELTERLKAAHKSLVEIATSLSNLQLKKGIDVDNYVYSNVNSGMMQVVYAWAQGTSFAQICEMTDILEGSIVRCIMRLEETCRDVKNAARVVGNAKLYQKMATASELLKRDIVYAPSMYIT
jgi:antiviral helicase SKI2